MTLQKFSLDLVEKVQQYVRRQLTLPPSEQQPSQDVKSREMAISTADLTSLDELGDLFRIGGFGEEDISAPNAEGRWFISTVDPASAVSKLPGLSLKPGIRLVTYLQRQSAGGMGVTWALPELMSTTAELEMALEDAGTGAIPPRPKGALGNVMDGIEGDRSAGSYITASILLRELKEFGRSGQNRRWFHQRLLAEIPTDQTWRWRTKVPKTLSPKVQFREDGTVAVEFFSCRVAPPVALFRHFDIYAAKSYRPKIGDQAIAIL